MVLMNMVSQWAVTLVTRLTTPQQFADMVMEAWYPQNWYKQVPSLAGVTKSLTKKEWANDPKALYRGIETRSCWVEI